MSHTKAFPEFFIITDSKPRAPPGTWDDDNNIRLMCEYIGKIYNFTTCEDWYKVKGKHFNDNHGGGLLRRFGSSASNLIFKFLGSKYNFNIWLFDDRPLTITSNETKKDHFISLFEKYLDEYKNENGEETCPDREWWENTGLIWIIKNNGKKYNFGFSWGELLKKYSIGAKTVEYTSKADGIRKNFITTDNKSKIIETLKNIYEKYGMSALTINNLGRNHSEQFTDLGRGIMRRLKPKNFKYRFNASNSYHIPNEYICLHLLGDIITEEYFIDYCKKENPAFCNKDELIKFHIKPAYEKIKENGDVLNITYKHFENKGYSGIVYSAKNQGIYIDELRQILGLPRGKKCITCDDKIVDSMGECFLYNFLKRYSKEEIEIERCIKYKDIDLELSEQLNMSNGKGYDIDFTIIMKDVVLHIELWGYWREADKIRCPDYQRRKNIKQQFHDLYRNKHITTNRKFIGINNKYGIENDDDVTKYLFNELSPYMLFDINNKPNEAQILTLEKTKKILLEEGKNLQEKYGKLPSLKASTRKNILDVFNLYNRVRRSELFEKNDDSKWDNFKIQLEE